MFGNYRQAVNENIPTLSLLLITVRALVPLTVFFGQSHHSNLGQTLNTKLSKALPVRSE